MSRQVAIALELIVVLAASVIAATVNRLLTGPMSWIAFASWVIFFASLNSWVVFQAARTGQVDVCTARLLHWLNNR